MPANWLPSSYFLIMLLLMALTALPYLVAWSLALVASKSSFQRSLGWPSVLMLTGSVCGVLASLLRVGVPLLILACAGIGPAWQSTFAVISVIGYWGIVFGTSAFAVGYVANARLRWPRVAQPQRAAESGASP